MTTFSVPITFFFFSFNSYLSIIFIPNGHLSPSEERYYCLEDGDHNSGNLDLNCKNWDRIESSIDAQAIKEILSDYLKEFWLAI